MRATPSAVLFDVGPVARGRVTSAELRVRGRRRAVSATRLMHAALTGRPLAVVVGPGRWRDARLVVRVDARPPLWRTDMESGTLSRWYLPVSGGGTSGGEFNSAGGTSRPTRAIHHSGRWAAQLELPSGSGGVRLFRWKELHEHRDVTASAWMLFPQAVSFGRGGPGAWWNVMQVMSRPAFQPPTPIWHVDVQPGAKGGMRIDLVWWQRKLEGPRPGQVGYRRFVGPSHTIPVNRWTNIRLRVRQSPGFSGRVQVWVGDALLFDERGVRTGFTNCAFNDWCVANEWSVNNYASALRPAPALLYVDDVRLDLRPAR